MISISSAAAKDIKRIQSSRQKPSSQLRLTVKQGGCLGSFYVLGLEEHHSEQTTKLDYVYDCHGITVLVDRQIYPQLEGLQLEYSEDLMGGGFRFQNPNVSKTCGCGLSFVI